MSWNTLEKVVTRTEIFQGIPWKIGINHSFLSPRRSNLRNWREVRENRVSFEDLTLKTICKDEEKKKKK